jgi:hypothetical protein
MRNHLREHIALRPHGGWLVLPFAQIARIEVADPNPLPGSYSPGYIEIHVVGRADPYRFEYIPDNFCTPGARIDRDYTAWLQYKEVTSDPSI